MTDIIYSNDPNNPLNKKIAQIIALEKSEPAYKENVTELCRQICDMGFEDGQRFVWELRNTIPKTEGRLSENNPRVPTEN